MNQENFQMRIRQDGHLKLDRTAYELHSVELFGPERIIRASDTVAFRVTKPGKVPPKSEIKTVGEQPEGFGKGVDWDPADAGLALVIFHQPFGPFGGYNQRREGDRHYRFCVRGWYRIVR